MTATVTSDFREEYEAERTRWLRRRFLWYAGVLGSYHAVTLVFWLVYGLSSVADDRLTPFRAVNAAIIAVQTLLFAGAFFAAQRRPHPRHWLDRMVFALTVISGSISILAAPFLVRIDVMSEDGGENVRAAVRGAPFVAMFGAHFIASLFIPWTVREAARPLAALVGVFAVVTLIPGLTTGTLASRLLLIGLSPLVGLPGLAIAWWRHSRFRQQFHYRMLRRRYGDLQREMVDARRLHESLFPAPVLEGPVRLHYRYEPMRQIGGDYLYASMEPARPAPLRIVEDKPDLPRLNVVLLDVTGHGVAAALTVNRLYGELERLFAEREDLPPHEVAAALNRYVNLTLAKQSVYATALCMRFDPSRDVLEWSNAGHPPAFVRTAARHIERLDSCAPLLGVFKAGEFEADLKSMRFGPGDTLVAYTDGATDTTNESGQRLRIDGLQAILANDQPEPDDRGRWAGTVLREIARHRFGASVDDILLVEVWRPV